MAKATKVAPVEEPQIEIPQNVTIIGFDAETKQILRALTEALANRPAPIINLTAVPTRAECSVPQPPITVEAPKTTAAANKPEPTVTVSLSQIRERISAKVAEGKTTAIVALLNQHGAKNASTLAEDQFESFYEALLTL